MTNYSPNVGIIHDWLPVVAGGEKVVHELVKNFPNSEIYTLFNFLNEIENQYISQGRPINVSRLNKIPKVEKFYRYLLLECAREIENFDVSKHDVVISSSAAVAKGVITRPGQPHIAYIHSPARYAWDLSNEYLNSIDGLLASLKREIARRMLHKFRLWDMRTTPSIDIAIANSYFIQKRIYKVYGIKSDVIYPPVNTESFIQHDIKDEFYLTASRHVPYKKIDLIVKAFNEMPDKRLIVAGDGPETQKIKEIAGKNIEIIGYQREDKLKQLMQNSKAFVFSALEDFGIMPLEAQACGTPVIALNKGGTAETIIDISKKNPTGVLFENQEIKDIVGAIETFEKHQDLISPDNCNMNAKKFSPKRFRSEIDHKVREALENQH